MTERRTANVSLTLAQVGQLLGLHETQRVFNAYVEPEPPLVIIQIEGGEELPIWGTDDDRPPPDWRIQGIPSPWVRLGEIPSPADQ